MDYRKPKIIRSLAILFILPIFFIVSIASAQSGALRQLIKQDYDFSKIGALHVDLEFDYEQNREKTLALAKKNSWTFKETLSNGTKVALQDVGTDGSPIYYETYSDNASRTSRAYTLHTNGMLNLDLNGAGMQVGVWDAGVALTTHQEYGGRVIVGDEDSDVDGHASMVTGSLISSGIRKEAQGVAYAANVITNDWSRDKIEVAQAAANGLLLSNHSYGIKSDRVPDWYFGSYIKVTQDWDRIMYSAPYYLMVNAAGNAQKRQDNQDPIAGTTADGFDLMLGFTLAKNCLTIAAAYTKIDRNGNLKEAWISPYSSFGPVDDGRIKPDIAGDGSSIFSTSAETNKSYSTFSGTSMATPSVTGALLLLQQYHEQLYGNYMKAATLKGLALHTADDVDSAGPDYKMGWGIMNSKRAAEVLQNKDYSTYIEEHNLEDNQVFSLEVRANGKENLMASISWTDPASEYVNSGRLNDATPALVNDLDIRISQNGTEVYPWKLNPNSPNAPATQGDNKVDPFERIEIPNAEGSYTITVTHKGALTNGLQNFSLLISGVAMTNCSLVAPESLVLAEPKTNQLNLIWNPVEDALYEVQYRKLSEDAWQTSYVSSPNTVLKELEINTEYLIRLRTFCSQNIPSEYSLEYQFLFLGEATEIGALDSLERLSIESEIKFSIYPNPAVEHINLYNEISETAQYMIVSASGIALRSGSAKKAKINVGDLATGLYVIQVQDSKGRRSAKFYKQ